MTTPELEQARQLKRLEMIQAVITRMAQNSFLIKGWSVTLCTALLALSGKDTKMYFAALPILPALLFWSLDGYYLAIERHFRKEYNKLAGALEMKLTEGDAAGEATWRSAMCSRAVWPIYGTVIAVALLILLRDHQPCPCK